MMIFNDIGIEPIQASLADSEDEDYVAAIPKPAAQKKQPAKKVGPSGKPLPFLCVIICLSLLQFNLTIS